MRLKLKSLIPPERGQISIAETKNGQLGLASTEDKITNLVKIVNG